MWKRGSAAGAVAVLAVWLAGCGGGGPEGTWVSRDAWEPLRLTGNEMEWYDSAEAMADAADLVVVGRITGFRPGRQAGAEDPVAGPVQFVDAVVAVDEVLGGSAPRGPAPAGALAVEFLAPVGAPDQLRGYLADLRPLVDRGTVVLFLRDKGTAVAGVPPFPQEAGLLRVINSYGLVTATREDPVDAPLGEVPDGEPGQAAGLDYGSRWTNLDRFIGDVRSHLG